MGQRGCASHRMNWHSGRQGRGVASPREGKGEGWLRRRALFSKAMPTAHLEIPWSHSLTLPPPPPPTHSLPVTQAQTAAKAQFKPRTLPPRPSLPPGNPHHRLNTPSEQTLPGAATKAVGYTRHPSPGKQAPPHPHRPSRRCASCGDHRGHGVLWAGGLENVRHTDGHLGDRGGAQRRGRRQFGLGVRVRAVTSLASNSL